MGKYGVDILAGGACAKSWQAYKNLRQANRMCTFEAVASSTKNAQKIETAAATHHTRRKEFFQNVKIEVDKQNKHIKGNHNFIETRSILTHEDPQNLLRQHAGTGRPSRNIQPGKPGYREIVNFKSPIGYNQDKVTRKLTSTTWGEIHYSKNGAHIVPIKPLEK